MRLVNLSKDLERLCRLETTGKDMAPELEKVGVKMVWVRTNPDESNVFVLVDMEDP